VIFLARPHLLFHPIPSLWRPRFASPPSFNWTFTDVVAPVLRGFLFVKFFSADLQERFAVQRLQCMTTQDAAGE
jgi:hypothetical protein